MHGMCPLVRERHCLSWGWEEDQQQFPLVRHRLTVALTQDYGDSLPSLVMWPEDAWITLKSH